MKAQDYVDLFMQDPTDHGFYKVISGLIRESSDLAKTRNVRTNSGLLAIFKELEQKFHAFLNLLDDKYRFYKTFKDAYKLATHKVVPEAKLIWP